MNTWQGRQSKVAAIGAAEAVAGHWTCRRKRRKTNSLGSGKSSVFMRNITMFHGKSQVFMRKINRYQHVSWKITIFDGQINDFYVLFLRAVKLIRVIWISWADLARIFPVYRIHCSTGESITIYCSGIWMEYWWHMYISIYIYIWIVWDVFLFLSCPRYMNGWMEVYVMGYGWLSRWILVTSRFLPVEWWWIIRGKHPKMAEQFRPVNYYVLPSYMCSSMWTYMEICLDMLLKLQDPSYTSR